MEVVDTKREVAESLSLRPGRSWSMHAPVESAPPSTIGHLGGKYYASLPYLPELK